MTRWAAVILCASWLVGAVCVDASDTAAVKWPKALELFQGGLSEIHVSGANLIDVNGRMGTTPIVFYLNGPGSFAAIIGADVEAKPGLSKVLLTAVDRAGAQRERVIPFRIKAKAFRKESFNVPPSFDQMSEETLEAIRREQATFARAFAYSVPERLWEAPFVRPVPQAANSAFGTRSIFNGEPRALSHSRHVPPAWKARVCRMGNDPRRAGGRIAARG